MISGDVFFGLFFEWDNDDWCCSGVATIISGPGIASRNQCFIHEKRGKATLETRVLPFIPAVEQLISVIKGQLFGNP